MASRSCSHAEAEKIVRSRQSLQLADDDFLFFQHASAPVSVQDTLKEGATLNNRRLADPLEPEYDGGNTSKAIFYWNNGKNPIIKSFAHGERIYSFTRYDTQQPGGSGAKNSTSSLLALTSMYFLKKTFRREPTYWSLGFHLRGWRWCTQKEESERLFLH